MPRLMILAPLLPRGSWVEVPSPGLRVTLLAYLCSLVARRLRAEAACLALRYVLSGVLLRMTPCCPAARDLRAEVVCLALLRRAGYYGAMALAILLPEAAARRLGSGPSL